jgi:hypothetical protein
MIKKPSGQILDLFTESEIEFLNSILNKLPDAQNSGDRVQAYTNGFCNSSLIYPSINKLVLSKLEKYFDVKFKKVEGMLLKEIDPWGIHTDYNKKDFCVDLAILVPLNIFPINTHTVVFNEESTDPFNQFKVYNKQLDINATTLHDTLCSHESIENLKYVSLNGVYHWLPGSAIYWGGKILHASDNFLANGLKEKRALVLFTTIS